MRNRTLKIFILFLSLALVALPMQRAFATPGADAVADMATSHCEDNTASSQDDTVAVFSTVSSLSNGCCCDQCDTSCTPDCSASLSISAIMLPATSAVSGAAHSVYISHYPHFTSRSTSPPSPPPLS